MSQEWSLTVDKYKTCTKCKAVKESSTEFFYKDSKQSSGLKPECRECTLAHKKIFYLQNATRLRARAKDYRDSNPEKWKAIKKAFRQRNPESVQIDRRRRKARKLAVSHEPYTAKQVLEAYGSDCHICGQPIDLTAPRWTAIKGYELGLHLDHVIRLADGGSDTLDNIRPAHGICNQIKN